MEPREESPRDAASVRGGRAHCGQPGREATRCWALPRVPGLHPRLKGLRGPRAAHGPAGRLTLDPLCCSCFQKKVWGPFTVCRVRGQLSSWLRASVWSPLSSEQFVSSLSHPGHSPASGVSVVLPSDATPSGTSCSGPRQRSKCSHLAPASQALVIWPYRPWTPILNPMLRQPKHPNAAAFPTSKPLPLLWHPPGNAFPLPVFQASHTQLSLSASPTPGP